MRVPWWRVVNCILAADVARWCRQYSVLTEFPVHFVDLHTDESYEVTEPKLTVALTMLARDYVGHFAGLCSETNVDKLRDALIGDVLIQLCCFREMKYVR